MLELPESHTIAAQMNEAIKGKQIVKARANESPHGFAFYFGDPKDYPALLEGETVSGAHAAAGQVEVLLGDKRLLFGDGANIRYVSRKASCRRSASFCLRSTTALRLPARFRCTAESGRFWKGLTIIFITGWRLKSLRRLKICLMKCILKDF